MHPEPAGARTDTDTDTDTDTARIHDRRWSVLAVLCLSVLLVVVDNTIVTVALPSISRQLSAYTSSLQWVVDAYTLVFAGLLLVGGNLGDRLGRRRMLQVGLALFALTSIGAALAQTTGQLVVARAAMGVGAALIYPSTLALLSNVFTDAHERATAIGIWAGVSGLAVAVGPISGGLLLTHFGWSSVFWLNVPLVLVALGLGRALLPESRDHAAGAFDAWGAALSIVGITALVTTIIEAPTQGWTSPLILGGFAAALLVLTAFVAWEIRCAEPLLDMRLFTNSRFAMASAAISLSFFGLFGFIFLITLYFQVILGFSPLRAGVATLPFALVTGSLSPVAILLMKRVGTKLVVTAGLALMSGGFALAASVTLGSSYWGRVVCSMVLMAAGLALTTGPASEAIMGALPRSKAGAGSAVNDTTRELGGTLGVAVIGSVLSSMYAAHVATSLTTLGAPAAAIRTARGSLVAGLDTVGQLPAAIQGPALSAIRHAFIDGLSAGSLVAAAVTGAAAIAALAWLPARPPSGIPIHRVHQL
ncbi:MAG: DHA2 family efflux MFS transporter permease subunit [Actinomycetota bacterium]|nr:DHA2 family efflux MFS transporter permease subunit [Actinomycetota bacterium]